MFLACINMQARIKVDVSGHKSYPTIGRLCDMRPTVCVVGFIARNFFYFYFYFYSKAPAKV